MNVGVYQGPSRKEESPVLNGLTVGQLVLLVVQNRAPNYYNLGVTLFESFSGLWENERRVPSLYCPENAYSLDVQYALPLERYRLRQSGP